MKQIWFDYVNTLAINYSDGTVEMFCVCNENGLDGISWQGTYEKYAIDLVVLAVEKEWIHKPWDTVTVIMNDCDEKEKEFVTYKVRVYKSEKYGLLADKEVEYI